MNELETEQLSEELRQFKEEKEKIRKLVGQIGGKKSMRYEKHVTAFLGIVMVILFVLDLCRHFLHMNVPFPPMFSIEVAVMLVSVKLLWMVHGQTKVEHFQFWILNSIEFRLNELSHDINKIQNQLKEQADKTGDTP